MQITHAMAVNIVFNSARIACADSRAVAYDRGSHIDDGQPT
jgi:hypothetical protein